MNQQIFTIFDNKAQAYLTPFFLPETAMAIRTFSDCCNDPKHAFYAHPDDYTLFHIGQFSNTTSNIDPQNAKSLGNGIEFKNQFSLDMAPDLFDEFQPPVYTDPPIRETKKTNTGKINSQDNT